MSLTEGLTEASQYAYGNCLALRSAQLSSGKLCVFFHGVFLMPLPLIVGAIAAVAGAAGVGMGVRGAVKMKEAKEDIEWAKRRHERNMGKLRDCNEQACSMMDKLGSNELETLSSFREFADLFECIRNRPEFKNLDIMGNVIPDFRFEELKDVSVGASVLAAGIGGAALGTAGAMAASGATTVAVMAAGTASTGAVISGLGGAAATSTALAAPGGVGMALGSMVLGGATLGVGLLVGGMIFSMAGSRISDQAEEAKDQMYKAESKIEKICDYLTELRNTARNYNDTLTSVRGVYNSQLNMMRDVVMSNTDAHGKAEWSDLGSEGQRIISNTVALVQVLYAMCKVKLVLKDENSSLADQVNTINYAEANKASDQARYAVTRIVNQ